VIIEPARAGDVPAIAAIERQAFSDPWTPSAFASMIGREPVQFVVVREGAGTPVLGYVVAIFAGDEGEIANVAVAEAARRRGTGAALVETVLAEAERRSVGALYLEVRESNAAARHLYGACGFEEVGRRRGYYRHPVEDALILRRLVGPGLK
jgi:ribosomal-protein-alanine N-acetyltransferase